MKRTRLCSGLLFAVAVLAGLFQILSGRYGQLIPLDTRLVSAEVLVVRTPLLSLLSRANTHDLRHQPRKIDTALGHLPSPGLPAITDARTNVVQVLVESWGNFEDAALREQIAAPLFTPEIRMHYDVLSGTVPFTGTTILGESRSLCSEIFSTNIEDVDSKRLLQCYPALFKRAGYDTTAIHGFYPHMYHRDEWMPRVGFEHTLFAPDLAKLQARTCYGGFVGTCDADVARVNT